MKLAPAFVSLTVVATVSAIYGAIFPAPAVPAPHAELDAPMALRLPAPRAQAARVEAVRLEGDLPRDLAEPSVMAERDGWRMWYVADGAIGHAVSADGLSWRRGRGAALTPGEGGPVATPTVVRRPGARRYRMWYAAADGIHLATSTDGLAFRPAGVALTGASALNAREGADVRLTGPEATYREGVYHMWFAADAGGAAGIGHATSLDGERWRPSPANPLPTLPDAGPGRPVVVWDDAAGRYAMWYRQAGGAWARATSPDGETWEPAAGTLAATVPAADAVASGGVLRLYAAAPPLPGPRLAVLPTP